MTSKLDTAGLVERLRAKRMRVHDLSGVGWEDDPDCIAAADLIEALKRERDELLYLQSELEAGDRIMQQRLEAAETRVEQLENSEEWYRLTTALEAAEARVAELEKQRDEARHELWETGLALGVIAKWPRVYFNRFYVEEWVLRTVTILKRWGVEFADGPLSVEGSRSIRNSRLSRVAHKGEGRG